MGLRETKKAATRAAMSEAAATIALSEGADGLTVAAIAESAGVSTRTFHNYFNSREEPLLEFLAGQVRHLAEQLGKIPLEVCMVDATEEILTRVVREEPEDLTKDLGALFRLADFLENMAGQDVQATVNRELAPLVDDVIARHPNLSRYEGEIALDLLATVSTRALTAHYEGPHPEDRDNGVRLIERAFHILRAIN